MFGMGSGEMLVIGMVALIVIGPKDLPGVFRTMGQFTGKARAMAREFSRAMDQAANQSGVNDISKSIKAATNPAKFGLDKLREATKLDSATKPVAKPTATAGSDTEKLSKERAEFKANMDAKAVEIRAAKAAALEETAAELAADAEEHTAAEPTPKPARKPRAKKVATEATAEAPAKPRSRKAPSAKAGS